MFKKFKWQNYFSNFSINNRNKLNINLFYNGFSQNNQFKNYILAILPFFVISQQKSSKINCFSLFTKDTIKVKKNIIVNML